MKRWKALLSSCLGNWSGSIGWVDIILSKQPSTSKANETLPLLQLRPNSHQYNMRMSFALRPDNSSIGDWMVYHAQAPGSKDHVVLHQEGSFPLPTKLQTTYAFKDGIVGRTGTNLRTLPILEHGFWADNMRRGIVIVYNATTLYLDRLCFLQQARVLSSDHQPFDVSEINLQHCLVLKKDSKPPHMLTNEERAAIGNDWSKGIVRHCTQELLPHAGRVSDSTEQLVDETTIRPLDCLLGTEGEQTALHIQLPNRVVVVCPWKIPQPSEPVRMALGYQRDKGQVQILDLQFDRHLELQTVRAHWYEKN